MRPTSGSDAAGPARSRGEPTGRRTGRRRIALALAGIVTIALGLGIRAGVDAGWAGPAGDVLYATLMYLVIAFLVPRRPRWQVAAVALAACWAIELFQATGVPAQLAQVFPPIRLLLGTTFVPIDMLSYCLGVGLALRADAVAGRLLTGAASPTWRRSQPT
ncbi:MAG: DUF2809 domain-containing protein [Brachybacterium faecium]|nr:MAG: DUF2809 domain-containing protein [Brachybacterium faecium]